MTLEEAIDARKFRAGLFDDYPWLVLPCRIIRLTGRRNYVIVYNTNRADLGRMYWKDFFFERSEQLPERIKDPHSYCSEWADLVNACKESSYWQAWTLKDLFRFNCQNLKNDPDAPRGLIVDTEV